MNGDKKKAFTLSKKVTVRKFQSILGLVLLLALADKAVWSGMHIHMFQSL